MLNALKKMFGFAPIEPVRVQAIPAPVVETEPVVETAGTPVIAPVVAEVKKARRVPAASAKKSRASRKAV
jgi:hypothetical protein